MSQSLLISWVQSRKCWAAPWPLLGDVPAPGEVQWCWNCPENSLSPPVPAVTLSLWAANCFWFLPPCPCSTVQITKKITKISNLLFAWCLQPGLCHQPLPQLLCPLGSGHLSPKQPQFCLPNPRAQHSCSSLKPSGRKGIISASHTAGSPRLVSISVANLSWSF